MSKTVLITGGAGFIGSHLADELISKNYEVICYDNLLEQVHGKIDKAPAYLNKKVEFIKGDVCDKPKLKEVLSRSDYVVHFAARVGVGQSMYELVKYTDTNNLGTATLLECLIDQPVEKLLVASSMSIYGEGLYVNQSGQEEQSKGRLSADIKNGQWEPLGDNGQPLIPKGTPETKQPDLSSIYALGKYDQERMCLITGNTYNIPTVAMRFFNVYGTRQSLSNPYTGVLAIFASRFLNDKPPLIFEDGYQKRDFVHVHDVAKACVLALENESANGQVFNVGSGNAYTVRDIAARLAEVMGKEKIFPEITHKYRAGDIRHCFADISRAKELLGFKPQVSLKEGLQELSEWLKDQQADDHVDKASKELSSRGLTV